MALSQVAVPGKAAGGSYWLVPPDLYGEIRQDAVLLKAGEKNPRGGRAARVPEDGRGEGPDQVLRLRAVSRRK